jgi:hypothetical protein
MLLHVVVSLETEITGNAVTCGDLAGNRDHRECGCVWWSRWEPSSLGVLRCMVLQELILICLAGWGEGELSDYQFDCCCLVIVSVMPPKKFKKGKVSPRCLRSPTRRRRPARFEASHDEATLRSRSPSPSPPPSPPPPRYGSSDVELSAPAGSGSLPKEGPLHSGAGFAESLPQDDVNVAGLLLAMQQELAETRREMRDMRDKLQAASTIRTSQPSAAAGSERDLRGCAVSATVETASPTIPAAASLTSLTSHTTPAPTTTTDALLSLMTAMELPANTAGEALLAQHLTLGATLSARVKQRIISGQFVDLSTMTTEKDTVPSLKFGPNEAPTLVYDTKHKKIENIVDWMHHFGMYAAILLGAQPTLGPSIVTYMVRIAELQKKYGGMAWRDYDIKFRQLKGVVTDNGSLPWHKVETSLLLDTVGIASPAPAPKSGGNQPFRAQLARRSGARPVFKCYDFNSTRGCSRSTCRFRHSCTGCGGSHAQSACPSKQNPPAKTESKPNQRSADAGRR